MRAPWRNPIVRLETRRRFRAWRAAVGLPLALALPAIVVTIAYAQQVQRATFSDEQIWMGDADPFGRVGPVPTMVGPDGVVSEVDQAAMNTDQMRSALAESWDPSWGSRAEQRFFLDEAAGRGLFYGTLVVLALVALVMVPTMVGPSIAAERAELTLQSIQLTRLSPTDIAVGKLLAPLSYLLWLGIGSVPLAAIAYSLGGVRKSALLMGYLIVALFVIELAVVALAFSARSRRPGAASAGSVLASIALCIVPPSTAFVGAMLWQFQRAPMGGGNPPESLLYLGTPSPIALTSWLPGIGDATDHLTGLRIASLVFWAVVTVLAMRVARGGVTTPVERDR